jgi:hypothetical protein
MQQPPIIAMYLGTYLIEEMRRAERLIKIGQLAASFVATFPTDVEMVFGPITSGGIIKTDPQTKRSAPSYDENLKELERTIVALQREGHTVLNQLVFRPFIDKHRKIWLSKHNRAPNTWYEPLKYELYAPILDTGKIITGHFILDWERGKSAKFAHDVLSRQKKEILEYPKGYKQQLAA